MECDCYQFCGVGSVSCVSNQEKQRNGVRAMCARCDWPSLLLSVIRHEHLRHQGGESTTVRMQIVLHAGHVVGDELVYVFMFLLGHRLVCAVCHQWDWMHYNMYSLIC